MGHNLTFAFTSFGDFIGNAPADFSDQSDAAHSTAFPIMAISDLLHRVEYTPGSERG